MLAASILFLSAFVTLGIIVFGAAFIISLRTRNAELIGENKTLRESIAHFKDLAKQAILLAGKKHEVARERLFPGEANDDVLITYQSASSKSESTYKAPQVKNCPKCAVSIRSLVWPVSCPSCGTPIDIEDWPEQFD